MKIFFILMLTTIIISTNVNTSQEGVYISSSQYRLSRELLDYDKGTIHVYIANNSDTAVEVKEAFLNDRKIDFHDNKVLWWRVCPVNRIELGRTAELEIKMKIKLHGTAKVEVKLNNGKSLTTRVTPMNPKLKFTYITVSDDLREIYAYVRNESDTVVGLSKIYFNGEDVTDNALFFEPELPVKAIGLVIIKDAKNLKVGDFVSLKIESREGELVESAVKVFTHFPIADYYNDTRTEMNFDENPHLLPLDAKIGKQYALNHVYYMAGDPFCWDNALKIIGGNSKKMIEQYEEFYKEDPAHPAFLFGCLVNKQMNYTIYGNIADAFSIGPYVIISDNDSAQRCVEYIKYAKSCCEPKPMWFTADAIEFRYPPPLPEQERLLIYYAISEEVKGVLYSGSEIEVKKKNVGYKSFPELEREIGILNRELQSVKGLLRISERIGVAECNQKGVYCPVLLCGDKAMIVFAINEDNISSLTGMGKEAKRKFKYTEKKDVIINVKTPVWSKVTGLKKLDGKSGKFTEMDWKFQGDKAVIRIRKLELTDCFIIEIDKKESAGLKPNPEQEKPNEEDNFRLSDDPQKNIDYIKIEMNKLKLISSEKSERTLQRVRILAVMLLRGYDEKHNKRDVYKLLIEICKSMGEYRERSQREIEYIDYLKKEFTREDAQKELGRITLSYYYDEDYISAIDYFEKIQKEFPDAFVSQKCGSMYINCFRQLNGIDSAIEVAGRIQDDPEIMVSHSILRLEKGEIKRSIQILEEVGLKFADYHAIDYVKYQTGCLYHRIKDNENARKYFEEVVRKFPESKYVNSSKRLLDSIDR